MAQINSKVVISKDYLLKNYKNLKFLEFEDELKCKRCERALINNYKANCGHYFCLNCKNVFSNGTGWRCPSCQTKITQMETIDVEIENKVFNLQVCCLNKKYGCDEIVLLKDLKSHHEVCENTKDVNLPAVYVGPHNISTIMDKVGSLAKQMRELRDDVLTHKTNTEEKLERESRNRDHFDERFSNLDHKVNGLASQLTENINKFETTSDFQIKSQLEEFSDKHENLSKQLEKLTNQQSQIESKMNIVEDQIIKLKLKNKPINILLMGESGSGKSTLINAFANYSQHSTFEEAKRSQEKCLINTKIVVANENYEETFITAGTHDLNENTEHNHCKSYLFPLGDNLQIRLIDTSQVEDANIKDIGSYLSQYDELHAVAIVMESSQSRITAQFDNCLQQILSFFYKSSTPNIFFIFTRTTEVADSLQTVKKALSDIEIKTGVQLDIFKNISKERVFCFENDGFNISIAIRNGNVIDEAEVEKGARNWSLAKTEFERLINNVIKLEPLNLTKMLLMNEAKQEVNILLLGQTGVGKSTLINAFANYLKYKTFEEAVQGEEICLIPTKFSFTYEDFSSTKVKAGPEGDPNENLEEGQSSTLSCKSYVFTTQDGVEVRLIDSPGFADTEGPEIDYQRFQDILQYVSQFKTINAIVVVSKADMVRANPQLQMEYQRIFEQFGEASIQNVILVFTHEQRPQGALLIVKSTFASIIDRLKWSSEPKFEKSKNIFCFENKPFRDILEIKRGLRSKDENASQNESTWKKSVIEFSRLIRTVVNMVPYDVNRLSNSSKLREFIRNLSLISGTILLNAQRNIELIKASENQQKYELKIDTIKVKESQNGFTVCFSEKCINKFPSASFNPNKEYKDIICCSGLNLLTQKSQNKEVICLNNSCLCRKEDHEFLFFSLSSNKIEINEGTVKDFLTKLKNEEIVIKSAIEFLIKFIENDYSIVGENISFCKSLLRSSINHFDGRNSVEDEETRSIASVENELEKLEIYGEVFRDVRKLSKQGKEFLKKFREVNINKASENK